MLYLTTMFLAEIIVSIIMKINLPSCSPWRCMFNWKYRSVYY